MLNNSNYINKIRETIKSNKTKKKIDISINRFSDEYNEDILNTIDSIYHTHNIIINHNKYQINDSTKKYIPNIIEFTEKQNYYTNVNNKFSNNMFFNLKYDNINNNNVFIVMYYINDDIIPFTMLFLVKDNSNKLYTFPKFNFDINKLDQFKENYKEDIHNYIKNNYNYNGIVKGIKNYNNTSYIFTEIKKIESNEFNKGTWTLLHELINDKKILNVNVNVNNITIDFIINNFQCITLNHNYEQPISAFQLINESELDIFYTLDNFNKLISNKTKDYQFHRVALFIGKLKINTKNDRVSFIDCNSIYKYDKEKELSMIIIKNNKQMVYLSSHILSDFI